MRSFKAQRGAGEFLAKLAKGKGGGDRQSQKHRVQAAPPSAFRIAIQAADIDKNAAKRYQPAARRSSCAEVCRSRVNHA